MTSRLFTRFGCVAALVLVLASSALAVSPVYVGGAACAPCHPREAERWRGSHHDLAMAEATTASVVGNFDGTSFDSHGSRSTFRRDGDQFIVNTDGADGSFHDFPIRYSFGVTPLQQYLIGFPDGRFQALSVAWDSRPKAAGGQRWFHLYPDERIAHDDELHWTGPNQNWNFMCADCHSTNLEKKYDASNNRFASTWSEIDVSCEACHGPGAAHVKWAEAAKANADAAPKDNGLTVHLKDTSAGLWQFAPGSPIAARTKPRANDPQVETCARCHARRMRFADDTPGRPLLDAYLPASLEERLYFADGQIRDEVYEYGSFTQSKMFRAGVVCSDCHDPHRLEMRADGDALCFRCHMQSRYGARSHHFHEPKSAAARCVSCHMPTRTYMGVDDRYDHSLRVPRPDLSEQTGSPNACQKCHAEKSMLWLADAAKKWWPNLASRPQIATTLQAGRRGAPGAESLLTRLATDKERPGIARATAAEMLQRYASPTSYAAVESASRDSDGMVRYAALRALDAFPAEQQRNAAVPLLRDPLAAVRIEAGRLLADVPATQLSESQRNDRDAAVREYVAAQQYNADRAFAHVNLGLLRSRQGDSTAAESEYRTAIRVEPRSAAAYVNLSDLYRSQDKEDLAGKTLREGLAALPRSAEIHHALGLWLVRQRNLPDALSHLAEAVTLRPTDPHLAYVYAVALHDTGDAQTALSVAGKALKVEPYQPDLLALLATTHAERGERAKALEYAHRLAAIYPETPEVKRLVATLEGGMGQ